MEQLHQKLHTMDVHGNAKESLDDLYFYSRSFYVQETYSRWSFFHQSTLSNSKWAW